VVVAGEGWPSGVVGIAAAKLSEEHGVPAFVLAVDRERGEARGSARSVPGVDLVDVMSRCSEHLLRYGGHAGAAGLTVDPARLDELTEALTAAVEREGGAGQRAAEPADAEVALAEVDDRLVTELGGLAPFGCGNEEPRLLSRGLRVRRSRRVGDGSHLKLELEAGGGARIDAIGFGLGELDPGQGAAVDALYAPAISTWGGRRRVELRICDLAPA
jgi:single-stranded-DNA-specific exonuclease